MKKIFRALTLCLVLLSLLCAAVPAAFAAGNKEDAFYTIGLDACGGVSSTVVVTTNLDGKLTTLPESPTMDGYTFNGWYTEPVGGSRITTATVFTGDTTIYAQWTAKSSSASPTAPTLPVTGGPALQKHLGTLLVAGILVTLVVVAAVAVLLATLFLPVLQVSGDSMNPTLEDRDILLLVKSDSMKTGDLCGFYWQNKLLLKRVIGQPGDVISMDEDGHVTVNGTVLDEPYVDELALGECDIRFPYQVPENRYFVLGDHRSVSIDSRSSVIGCVEKSQVVGRVFLRIWPLNRLAVF